METIVNIIFITLFIVVCIFAGWSFGSCIKISKDLKEINKDIKFIKQNMTRRKTPIIDE